MKRILVVGGANGIGLSIAKILASHEKTERVYIVDKTTLAEEYRENKIISFQFDLTTNDYSIFDQFTDCPLIGYIANYFFHAVRYDFPSAAAVEQPDFPCRILRQFLCDRRTDRSGSAYQ